MAEMQLTREIEMLKLSNTQNISLEKIKAQLADTAIKERGKKELFAAEQQLKLSTGSGI
jgi:DNA-directed RNA polymerase alpha subunit